MPRLLWRFTHRVVRSLRSCNESSTQNEIHSCMSPVLRTRACVCTQAASHTSRSKTTLLVPTTTAASTKYQPSNAVSRCRSLCISQELAKLLSVLHTMGSSNTSSPASSFIQLVQALHQLVSGLCTPEQLQPLAECWLAMLMAKVLCAATASAPSATAGTGLAMPMGSGSALAVADDPGSTHAAVVDPGSARGQRVHVEALLGCATQVRSHACT